MKSKDLIKKISPPLLLDLIRPKNRYGFTGNYKTWSEASLHSRGYNDPKILEKIKIAALKVKNGEAAYERDSVLFYESDYVWPLLASLLWIAGQNNNALNVLDFGGSLGSTYFQHRNFLKHLAFLKWNIVEQENFVKYGKELFEDEHLKFFCTIEECLADNKIDVLLASSVIQYIEKPYELLEKIIRLRFECILFDRTPFWEEKDRLTIQKVPPRIYDASYPAWIMNVVLFKEFFTKSGYNLLAESDQGTMIYNSKEGLVKLKNFIFMKCSN